MFRYVLTGNTYEHRQTISRIPGARWDATSKAWIVDESRTPSERREQTAALSTLRRTAGIHIDQQ